MGICSSQKNKEIKNKTNEIIYFKINESKINEIISFQQKENKLIEYGLLINNYFFDPITGQELWYDKRIKNIKIKLMNFIILLVWKKKRKKE